MDYLGTPVDYDDLDLLRPKAPPNKPPRTFSSLKILDSRPGIIPSGSRSENASGYPENPDPENLGGNH